MEHNRAKKKIQLPLDDKAYYAALCAHDARFDGRFFVGVTSTGVYCRPICRAKLPKEENCRFFSNAAAAEAAGYRPCLKCRPELAPGLAPADAAVRIAQRAALTMEGDYQDGRTISDLAEKLNITDRHLRRIFFNEYGVSPVQYLQTLKLLLAKRLLTDTQLSVTEVAMTAGFGSIRRFNDLFQKRYRLTPSRLRKIGTTMTENNGEITLSLGYRPPYAWDELIDFLAKRAVPGVENVANGVYRRTVTISRGETFHRGWISVANMPKTNSLSITLAPALMSVLSQVLLRIRCLFDVNCNPSEIYEKLKIMNKISPDICIPGMRVPGCFDPFEISARAILGQQVTVKAARTLAMRLAAAFGDKVETTFEELSVTFPGPDTIYNLKSPIENHLGPLGITGARARSIYALAEALVTGSISFSSSADPLKEMEKLRKIPGLGPWTVQYIGMRAFGWPDAFPHTDHGVKKAFPGIKPQDILNLSQAWKPWRSYATLNLWNSLKKEPNERNL
jgi:AraC family transcriptional regulator of adaptative response / DNA-3-methyladenine glycosylase II